MNQPLGHDLIHFGDCFWRQDTLIWVNSLTNGTIVSAVKELKPRFNVGFRRWGFALKLRSTGAIDRHDESVYTDAIASHKGSTELDQKLDAG
jgi:hypothetical protein